MHQFIFVTAVILKYRMILVYFSLSAFEAVIIYARFDPFLLLFIQPSFIASLLVYFGDQLPDCIMLLKLCPFIS